jgi:UDP-N-acetylmuramoyl-L-alanyl-D-glutamate--2,6-diaminopimelate ligase
MFSPKPLQMLLDSIAAQTCSCHGKRDRLVAGIDSDSRRCRRGWIFLAFRGQICDGHRFAADAVKAGAETVVHTEPIPFMLPEVTYIQVSDMPEAAARLCAEFYGWPSRRLTLIGVTGTDGKSTACDYLQQLLTETGTRTALLSSIWIDTGNGRERNTTGLTTLGAADVHRQLALAVKNGCRAAVLEASSHGLSRETGRLSQLAFHAALCTGITSDHLDFHGSREAYIDAKMNLFRQLVPGGAAVVPADADWLSACTAAAPEAQLSTWQVRENSPGSPMIPGTSLVLTLAERSAEAACITLAHEGEQHVLELPLPFTAQIRAAAAAALTLNLVTQIPPKKLLSFPLKPVRGRYQLRHDNTFGHILIDYAHTPAAFSLIFSDMRTLFPDAPFTAVFGGAGGRDRAKRPLLGSTAARFCDTIIITEDDPRNEELQTVSAEIAAGVPRNYSGTVLIIPDRSAAIRTALARSGSSRCLLLLGKGSEHAIVRNGRVIPWDEEEALTAAAEKMRASR